MLCHIAIDDKQQCPQKHAHFAISRLQAFRISHGGERRLLDDGQFLPVPYDSWRGLTSQISVIPVHFYLVIS